VVPQAFGQRQRGDPAVIKKPAGATAALTLAERKRQVVRDELGEAALQLIARQGYEETTVDQIVAAAGVSRRTFFRYFASKEDVIIEFIGDVGEAIVGTLAERPAAEPPAIALREAVKDVAAQALADFPEKSMALIRFTLGIPALRARWAARQDLLREDVATALAVRAGDGTDPSRMLMTAGIVLLAFAVALDRWVAADAKRWFGELMDEAFAEAAGSFTGQAGQAA
jgi:AcrR family transcriptional regulator